MKPHIILHMGSSIDGRIVPAHWPKAAMAGLTDIYERIHRELGGDAWLVGRVTMAEFAEGEPRPVAATERFPRTTWKAPGAERGPYALAIDQSGKLHLNIAKANGDPIVCVLTEAVTDDHLAELRRDGISYLFAGATELDLSAAVAKLAAEFGIARLLLEGGGGINGSFLAAGLIDEISLLLIPVADGSLAMPSLFDREARPSLLLKLRSIDRLEGDVLHLRYDVGA
jgi:riboflavin biosynthesis pyrimidine reductase